MATFHGRRVKIGHTLCAIEPLTPIDSQAGGCNAFISLDYRTIKLCYDLPEQTQAENLLHELTHAIRRIWGITVPSEQDEEQIVNMTSHGLACVMCDNPRLIVDLVTVLSQGRDDEVEE